MKNVKLTKKLVLNKSTICTLDQLRQSAVKAGLFYTALDVTCRTWDPVCPTQPVVKCAITE